MKRVGYVVDVGTTTIDSKIIDLETGKDFIQKSDRNPQRLYGSDVLTRIMTVKRDHQYLSVMRDQVLELLLRNMKSMLETIQEEHKQNHGEVIDCKVDGVVISGNTTMISILLNLDISDMGSFPFPTPIQESVVGTASTLFACEYGQTLPVSEYCTEGCKVLYTGAVSAFFGGDIVAGLLYLEKADCVEEKENYLLLDLGTNGEMVVKKGNQFFATSTACGPAFEGCARKQHAYGCSLLEAIALGRKLHKIHENGSLQEEYLDTGIVIHGITLTSEILQSIMLAKSAIRAGIQCLLQEAGMELSNLDCVYVAGGFGFHLNMKDAIYLGMFPEEFMGKAMVVGNTSLEGATFLLNHPEQISNFELMRKEISMVDLTQVKDFQEWLITGCRL